MRISYKLSLLLIGTSLMTGCSGKNFTMQEYADKWFNEKEVTTGSEEKETSVKSPKEAENVKHMTEEPKKASNQKSIKTDTQEKPSPDKSSEQLQSVKHTQEETKKNPANDIAWSSTQKADERNKGEGAIQKKLDSWLQEEWEPAFEGDEEQAKKDKQADEHFTLQHYVDKAEKYLEKKELEDADKPKEPAHFEKLESMPVIGK